MKAIGRKASALASQMDVRSGVEGPSPSPEHSNAASSGTYFRAVRPTEVEAAAVARGEVVVLGDRVLQDKVRRLTGAVEAGLWQLDSEIVAGLIIDDAAE
jgi:anti-sigma28 factor (negative regulator of flagellin synthesis)